MNKVSECLNGLIEAMRADEMYAWSWQCNIAMAAVDQGVDHQTANHAAARFMHSLFDVDVMETEMWHALEREWQKGEEPPETKPCLLCGKQLSCAVNDWETMQPYGGGEVRFVFGFGSCEFDCNSGSTEFRAPICDGCAKQHVDKMEHMGRPFGMGEMKWLPAGTPLERGA